MNQDPRNRRFKRLDIRLPITFQEVMALGKLKVAAVNLGLTQSAVSHALRRPSAILRFQLFVRRLVAFATSDRETEFAPAVGLIVATALGIVAQGGYHQGAGDVQPS